MVKFKSLHGKLVTANLVNILLFVVFHGKRSKLWYAISFFHAPIKLMKKLFYLEYCNLCVLFMVFILFIFSLVDIFLRINFKRKKKKKRIFLKIFIGVIVVVFGGTLKE